MFKNPKTNRTTGYIIMFIGFFLFYRGFHTYTIEDGINGKNIFLIIFALVLTAGAIVWMFKKVRCPHCGALLHLKLYNIDTCPHCGKSINNPDE